MGKRNIDQNAQSFEANARTYASARPSYPPKLFAYLADIAPRRHSAWDCATGNGQAALSLAEYFDQVQASDFSPAQIAQAPQVPNIRYSVQEASKTNFADQNFDLITVAQALHWFAGEDFYAEVDRVLQPGGILAVWGYAFFRTEKNIISLLQQELYPKLKSFWSQGNRHVAEHYLKLPFPYEKIQTPEFHMPVRWGPKELLNYLRSWSAVHRRKAETGLDPTEGLDRQLEEIWPKAHERLLPLQIEFDFFLLVGRKGR
jgi:SAM-dependent methyltransferase